MLARIRTSVPQLCRDRRREEDKSYADENELGWRNIIFVPFGSVWQIMLNMSVFLNSFTVIYILAYGVHEEDEMSIEGVHYVLEIIFFVDTVLFIMHRKMRTYQIIRDHEPRCTSTLTVDILTLLPIYEIYFLLTHLSRHGSDLYIRRYMRTKSVVRLYRICIYFHKMKARAASNKVWFIVLQQFFTVVMSVHFLGALWYALGCWQCTRPNWTQTISAHHQFDDKSPFHWFLFSYGTIGNLFLHNYKGEIYGVTSAEKLLFLSTMVLGHLMHYTIFLGSLIISNINQQRRHYSYVRRIKNMKTVLEVWRIDNELKKLTLNYYDKLWNRYSGIKYMPSAYELLPTPLKKEVMLDLFWDALNHSYLFQDEDVPFKRALSLEMKSEFYQAGDFVLRINQFKTKMIFISSGVLEVLSEEDETVAIMSFSSGTVIGEISLMRPMNSTASIRCASVCELHTLPLPAFYRVLRMFPEKLPTFRSVINNRIRDAENVLDEMTTANRGKGDTIIWLKKKWKELCSIQTKKSSGRQRATEKLGPLIHVDDRYHTVDNLGLLVLSEEIELKMKAICLNKHCPFVLEPNSSFQTYFRHALLFVILLQNLWIPYVFAFEHVVGGTSFSTLFLFDCFYFLDIYLQLSTAIKHRNHTSASNLAIAVEKIRSVWFLIDVLATIPADYVVYYFNSKQRLVAFLKLNRLLKGYKLVRYVSRKENDVIMGIVTLKFLKYILIYVIMGYFSTCLLYSMACYEDGCYENGWYTMNNQDFINTTNLREDYDPVVGTVYYTLSILLCVKQSLIIEYLKHEKIIRHVMVYLAYCAFSLFFSEICAAMVLSLQETQGYREYIASMKVFLTRCKISAHLRKQVAAVIEFKWAYNKNVVVSGPSGILFDAPEHLKTKVILGRIERCLKKSSLFKDCADDVLIDVALVATLRAVPPDVVLGNHDFKSNCLYVILRGYCALYSLMPGDRERASRSILTFGDCFPVVETFHQVILLVDVKSLTAVQLVSINRDDLFRVLKRHPLVHDELAESIRKHYNANKSKLVRQSGRLPPMIPPEKSLGHGDMFTYTVSDKADVDTAKEAFLMLFQKMGRLSVLKYLLCVGTVNPKKAFFLSIETFHYACGLSRTITAIIYDNVFFPHKVTVNWFFRATDVLYVIFLYVRMHVQYYNESGLLITHAWMTMKHYVSTSFPVDLWSFVPISYSGFYDFIGQDNRIMTGFIIRITSRPLQMHRFIGLLNYFQSNIQSPRLYTIQAAKYITISAVVIGLVGMVFQYHTIKVTEKGIFYANNSWVALSNYDEDFTLFMVFLACLNMSFTAFTTIITGTYVMVRNVELLLAIFVCSFYFIFRVFLYSKLACSQVGGSSKLTVYQEDVKSFENFMKHELVEETLVEATIEDHRFLWKNKDVGSVVASLSDFHDYLHVNLIYQLHESTLKACDAFKGADESFYRQLAVCLKESNFSKDSDIIRCNDIQDLVYIVKKGKVDVMLAKSKLCSMAKGGIFGCFQRYGKTRQTITVVARVHVAVLTVPSSELLKMISGYPHVEMTMTNANIVNFEYLEAKRDVESDLDQGSESLCSAHSKQRFLRFLHCGGLVKDNSKLYKVWNYVSSVHIASISAIIYSFLIVMMQLQLNMTVLAIRILTGMLDVYFLVRIYVGAHLIYKDADSGVLVKDLQLIRRRYFCSLSRFWIDFITVFPFEYLASAITDNINSTKYGYTPRLLRCWFMYKYYKEQEENLNVRQHLRVTYLLYRVVFSIQWTACIWWLCYCYENRCRYSSEGLFLAYLNVINIFTINGLKQTFNDTKIQMILFIVLGCMSLVNLLALISGYATKVKIGSYSQANYEYDIEKLRIYLKVYKHQLYYRIVNENNQFQDRDLSPFILNKVWRYCLQLWHRQRGEWMPNLITGAPTYLKQDLMGALYGHHIYSHFLFSKTHTDFTRQLQLHLKRCVFFPGNFIVEKGDIDGCMYFIHRGQVTVVDVQEKTEVTRELLVEGKSFGEAQGLFVIPHQFSYRAHTIVDTISLQFSDWEYLMRWFPASRESIYTSATEFGVRNPTKQLK